jgi:hypothetical protein
MNNYPRKVTATWSKDGDDLLFTFGNNDPEEDYFYYVPRKDLLNSIGRINWMRQLCEKNWFTDELKLSVIQMISRAANE